MTDQDTTWEHALTAVRSTLRVPTALSTLIRGAWAGHLLPNEFMRLIGFPGCNASALLRAAEISPKREVPEAPEIEAAVQQLGIKASAVMLSMNYVCQSVLEAAPPDKLWTPVLKEMMNEVEVGHHFGLSADTLGSESGMLVAFSQWAGLAVILARQPREFADWLEAGDGVVGPRAKSVDAFGFESYQASSMVLQQLGFGAGIASAAAIACGDLRTELLEQRPEVATWRAARRWIGALRRGERYPDDAASQQAFPELVLPPLCELRGEEPPAHLGILYDSVGRVNTGRSLWTWHLPKPSYEESAREVAKYRSAHSYSTSRTFIVTPS
mgnify:CR=1 FL=1